MSCNVGDQWESFVPRRPHSEGGFEITTIDSSGNFKGTFFPGRQPIEGFCDNTTMQFKRPANFPRYNYHGEFVSSDLIQGTRTGRDEFEGDALPPADDWEATKITGVDLASKFPG